jgi:predicted transglutaminase-like cysteine proteinase
MARCSTSILLTLVAAAVSASGADARGRAVHDQPVAAPIAGASPTLAPFQHVRFCLRYPDDCKSNPAEDERIDLTAQTFELLTRVNREVNIAIIPEVKGYGPDLVDGWTIAPGRGDCNDYAVTKRHELLESGLSSRALRLSVVKTASGIGHLVLVVVTTKGDLVMDNLSEELRPWQSTDYHWLKIQSASDARFWYEVKAPTPGPSVSQPERRVRVANR